jgi:hypothetical protein
MPTSELKKRIRNIPDFPKKGIQFKDITPVLADARLFSSSIDLLTDGFKPGDIFTQTLTWPNPPLGPGKYWVQGGITSRRLDLSFMLEKYLVTIS